MNNIANELKIYELSLIYKEAEYNFAFWDKFDKSFNWDEEYKKALVAVLKTNNTYDYYLQLMKFISLLKDGHTSISFPDYIMQSKEYSAKLPISIEYIDGNYVITNVKTIVNQPIKRFSIIKKINGIDIKKYIKDNIYPYIYHEKEDSCSYDAINFLRNGKINETVELVLEDNDKEYCVSLLRTKGDVTWKYPNIELKSEEMKCVFSSKSLIIQITYDNIAILTIDSMMNNEIQKEIFNNYELLKNAKGYVIDIRNNSGGSSYNADCIASLFVGNSFKCDNSYYQVHIGLYKAFGIEYELDKMDEKEFNEKYLNNEEFKKVYDITHHKYYEHSENIRNIDRKIEKLTGPIAILCSSITASAAEDFVNIMKYYTKAIIIGTATYGSTGMQLRYDLESGGCLKICTRKSLSLDGSEFINIGFKPDIECKLSINDYQNNNDKVMKEALKIIREKLNSK